MRPGLSKEDSVDPQERRIERRLTAIFAADVAGYSRLMEQDEVGTLRALTVHREVMDRLISDHGGRIANTAGDSVLAEFPSAVDAVQCAVEVQEKIAAAQPPTAILFRIGLHVGDVMVHGGDLLGDGVNIAARLQALAEPGGICISAAAHEYVRKAMPLSFADLGPQRLKNVDEAVRVYALKTTGREPEAAGLLPLHARPAIAVLPFTNMSGDPEQEYFADGLTEDVITALSYWRWFPVIARNSTFSYKGQAKSVTEIGRELGASYLVEGSVRRAGVRIRITVKLVATSTGHQVWAERYEREITDIFVLQDEITERIVASIEPELHRAEQNRIARKSPESLDVWDLALQALALQHRMHRRGHAEARSLLNRALAVDPKSSFAWSRLALGLYHEAILGWAEDRDVALRASLEAAERAIDLDDRDWIGYGVLGMGQLWTHRDFDAALSSEERAVSLNPSAPLARHFLACILEFSGRPGEAIPHLQAIHRLDPHYEFASLAVADEALCELLLGNMEVALTLADKALRMLPANVRARQRLCATLVLLGRVPEGQETMEELLRMQPNLTSSYITTTYPFRNPMDQELFSGALLQAGLPR
jgi:adenylate cyclase